MKQPNLRLRKKKVFSFPEFFISVKENVSVGVTVLLLNFTVPPEVRAEIIKKTVGIVSANTIRVFYYVDQQ